MTFLPIVARELRVASRRRATFWLRTGAALWPIGLGTWFFLVVQTQSPQMIAKGLFGMLTGTTALYCLFSGLRSTADCLSSEKREGTLGLLFLTDLRGYDVVLGKLVATSISTFYGVLAVVPTLAIPMLLGGITAGEFTRMGLVILNTMFFSLAMGMFASSLLRSWRHASGLALLLVICFFAVLPACGSLLEYYGRIPKNAQIIFMLPSPGFTYFVGFASPFVSMPKMFWWSFATVHCIAWGFLVLSSLIAPHSWQDRPRGTQSLKWHERWRLWTYGNSAARSQFRARLLDRNAIFWLIARARFKPALVWLAFGLVGCVWAWGLIKYEREWLNQGAYLFTAVCMNILLKAWFAAEAARPLAEDRQRGALELLLSTPLSVRDVLQGHLLALRRQFQWPVLVFLLLCVVFVLAGLREIYSERGLWVWLWITGMVMLVADLAALYWVAMWQGLTARTPQKAGSATLAQILAVPWIGMALAALVISLLLIRRQFEPSEYLFLVLWVGLGAAADVAFAGYARHKLLTRFREAAADPPKPGLLGALFGSRHPGVVAPAPSRP